MIERHPQSLLPLYWCTGRYCDLGVQQVPTCLTGTCRRGMGSCPLRLLAAFYLPTWSSLVCSLLYGSLHASSLLYFRPCMYMHKPRSPPSPPPPPISTTTTTTISSTTSSSRPPSLPSSSTTPPAHPSPAHAHLATKASQRPPPFNQRYTGLTRFLPHGQP